MAKSDQQQSEFVQESKHATVFLVEDDDAMRRSLEQMLADAGLTVESFRDPQEFLECFEPCRVGCLVLDLRLPGMNGLELYEHVANRGWKLPFVIITGYGDVPLVIDAFRKGAIDFIEKPFRFQQLLDRVHQAIAQTLCENRKETEEEVFTARRDSLTPREREFMDLLLTGLSTKRAAARLGISPKTAHIHRAKVLEKMEVGSVVQLVQLVSQPGR